jgi:hypothetical protein
VQGVHNRTSRFCSQRKECASELCGVRKERARRAHQSDHKLKRNLKVTEYLRGGTVRKKHRETKLLRTLSKLCQVGIEPVQVCTEELCVEFGRNRVTEYSVRRSSARSALSRRMPGGREVFLVQEILRI